MADSFLGGVQGHVGEVPAHVAEVEPTQQETQRVVAVLLVGARRGHRRVTQGGHRQESSREGRGVPQGDDHSG